MDIRYISGKEIDEIFEIALSSQAPNFLDNLRNTFLDKIEQSGYRISCPVSIKIGIREFIIKPKPIIDCKIEVEYV